VRIAVISDLHCGHAAGLTPPGWWVPVKSAYGNLGQHQREAWNAYKALVKLLSPVDVLVCNGDAIDGKGKRSGGVEQVVSDRHEQVRMAVESIAMWGAGQVFLTRGTPYHVGDEEDFEDVVAREAGGSLHTILDLDCDGVRINARHKIGTSAIPHGRATAVMRSAMWTALAAARDTAPAADIVIRSHAHYYVAVKDSAGLAIVTPALQAATRYGEREMDGTTDWGMIAIETNQGDYAGDYTCTDHLVRLRTAKRAAVKVS
jgi:hypothetical protein